MVTSTPIRPLPFLILYLDQGRKDYAGKTITFKEVEFIAKVLSFGVVERTIPYPSGLISIPDCLVEVEDTNGQIRGWFDERTPLRRIGEIAFEFEANATEESNLEFPVPSPENQDGPLPDLVYKPFFTGEIVGAPMPVGSVQIRLKSTVSSWLERVIPFLGVRDNYPNMPDDVESIFIPIILGRVYSRTGTGLEPQGVIKCHHIDTTLHRYVVARHSCHSVNKVYRKRKLDARFYEVPSSEYTIVEENKVINGITYAMTYIQFDSQQFDGTEINADVSGIDFRYDFSTETVISGVEVRDPVDSLINLILFILFDEVNLQRFDSDSILETRTRTVARGYKCDGAITEQMSNGLAVSKLCGDFLIDFAQDNRGRIKLHLYDEALDAESVIPLDDNMILMKSLNPEIPADKIKNRITYRYYRQNAGLEDFIKSSNTGQWGVQYTVDNLLDQAELAATGANPLLELQVEMPFVRDDATAKQAIRDRLGYHTLRSYTTTLDLSGPRVIDYLSLSDPIAVTEIWGIGPPHSSPSAGWVDKVLKVFGITFDLTSLECHLAAVVPVTLDDENLDWSIDGSHPAHDAQVRNPMIAAQINGNLIPVGPSASMTYDPDASPTVDLNDSVPAAPVGMQNIQWQSYHHSSGGGGSPWADPVDPRQASAYVPGFAPVIGTLDPDTKPAAYHSVNDPDGLRESQAGKVLFYATDFDHHFLFIGRTNPHNFPALPGETFDSSEGAWDGNTTGWRILDNTIGQISFRHSAPPTVGWALLDGTTFTTSTPDGGTVEVSDITDDLTVGDRFLRTTSAYETFANPNSNAVAPTLNLPSASGEALSDGAHNHTGETNGGVADGSHEHDVTNENNLLFTHTHSFSGTTTSEDGAHTHTGTPAGTVGAGGSHNHTGSTNSGTPDGEHNHGVAGTTDEGTGVHFHDITSLSGTAASNGDHSHSAGSLATAGPDDTVTTAEVEGVAVASDTHGHAIVGNTSTDGAHTHDVTVSGNTDTDGDHIHTLTGEALADAEGYDSNHTHVISTQADHTHTFTGSLLTTSSNGLHTHTLSSGTTGAATYTGGTVDNPDNKIPALSLLFKAYDETVRYDSSHVHGISEDGSHTHTLDIELTGGSIGTNGRPKSFGLMPYIRL